MRLRLYSIRDKLLGVYLSPFVARAHIEAVRQLKASLSDPAMAGSGIAQSPGDYELCYVSTFDDETGQLFPEQIAGVAEQPPILVAQVADIIRPALQE